MVAKLKVCYLFQLCNHTSPGTQSLWLVRQTVLPRLCFSLRLAMVPLSKLQALDAVVKKWVKKTVHLPSCCPTAFLYLPLRLGGLGLVELARTIPYRTAKCLYKMQQCGDAIDCLVASSMLGRYSRTIDKLRLYPSDLEAYKQASTNTLLESFHKTAWGIDHQALVASSKPLGWVCEGSCLGGGQYVQAVQLYSGNLPTRLALHRGRQVDIRLLMCRRCHRSKETPAHVLNDCDFVHRAIVNRHNAVVNLLAKELSKRPQTTVHKEVLVKVNMEGFRPDMLVLENEKIYIVEVTVPFDHHLEHLGSRFQAKLDKYNIPDIKRAVADKLNKSFEQGSVEVLPVVIGSRGVVPSRTVNSLKKLNIARISRMLQACVIRNSLSVWNIFRFEKKSVCHPGASTGRRARGGYNATGALGRPPDHR